MDSSALSTSAEPGRVDVDGVAARLRRAEEDRTPIAPVRPDAIDLRHAGMVMEIDGAVVSVVATVQGLGEVRFDHPSLADSLADSRSGAAS